MPNVTARLESLPAETVQALLQLAENAEALLALLDTNTNTEG